MENIIINSKSFEDSKSADNLIVEISQNLFKNLIIPEDPEERGNFMIAKNIEINSAPDFIESTNSIIDLNIIDDNGKDLGINIAVRKIEAIENDKKSFKELLDEIDDFSKKLKDKYDKNENIDLDLIGECGIIKGRATSIYERQFGE